ncbi:hypothetical protein Pmani_003679 [Petrolisthes manimaculis]|uniref:Ionotropic glutamate receptor C-terminal domain-containing protein n=1 Tax=Petrolisthes manimaculis TaxID=1843537 RepID=A0AAE1QG18_9EUCA|nr:hypothetical protein Pmani_003679 [Petrolisthes manimaculis]
METVGCLLGQGFLIRLSSSSSNYTLLACWLMFGLLLSTVYRGSLIASLTLPRPPTRPETVEELVRAVERVTYESYGSSHKTFFCNSESPTFKALGELIYVGVKVVDGLRAALQKK